MHSTWRCCGTIFKTGTAQALQVFVTARAGSMIKIWEELEALAKRFEDAQHECASVKRYLSDKA
jgi:hypothetical protein